MSFVRIFLSIQYSSCIEKDPSRMTTRCYIARELPIHFHSFLLIFLTVGLPVMIYTFGLFDVLFKTRLGPLFGNDPYILVPLIAGLLLYLFFALACVYGQSYLATGFKALGLLVCEFGLVVMVIRPILFFMTYYSL